MTEIKGAALLKQYAEQTFPYQWHRINERIQCVVGLGHSNSIIIEGDTSIILVDTLDSDVRAAKMKAMIAEQTDKPVRTFTRSAAVSTVISPFGWRAWVSS